MIQIVEVHEPLLQRKKLARGRENDEEVKTVKPSKKTKPRHDRDGAHAAVDDAKTLYAKMVSVYCPFAMFIALFSLVGIIDNGAVIRRLLDGRHWSVVFLITFI